jgi:predicted nucleic acid-binding protein
MAPSRPRVILDCNILVQAVLAPDGPGRACLALADAGEITLVTSRETLAEAGMF